LLPLKKFNKVRGGLPLGVEGRLVALFSGGIDSPVAAWMMMKRGCRITPIYVDLESLGGERALARAKEVAKALRAYQPDLELLVMKDRFLADAKDVLRSSDLENYACLICKRRMYRIAESVAKDIGAKGIVTGESLGQVASQMLDNLFVLVSAVSIPVYRPLIGFDKVETERIAKEIGTFEPSILPAEGCPVCSLQASDKGQAGEGADDRGKAGMEHRALNSYGKNQLRD
jgi:thiamine biosynthesis protein ThiI